MLDYAIVYYNKYTIIDLSSSKPPKLHRSSHHPRSGVLSFTAAVLAAVRQPWAAQLNTRV